MFVGNMIENIKDAFRRKEKKEITELEYDNLVKQIIVQPQFSGVYKSLTQGLQNTKPLREASESQAWELIKGFIDERMHRIIALMIAKEPEAQALLGLVTRMEKAINDREELVTVYKEIHRIYAELKDKKNEVKQWMTH